MCFNLNAYMMFCLSKYCVSIFLYFRLVVFKAVCLFACSSLLFPFINAPLIFHNLLSHPPFLGFFYIYNDIGFSTYTIVYTM